MSANYTDIVKQGYVRMKSKNLGVWQRRWVILRKASSRGRRRLEKHSDERTASQAVLHKMIELTDVKAVCRLPADIKKYAVAICFKDDSSRLFSCESDCEADDWIRSLSEECLGKTSTIRNGEPDLLDTGWQREFTDRYHVFLEPCCYLDIYGECLLQVTAECVHVWDANNPTVKLVTWPIASLRRYGHNPATFTFEASGTAYTRAGMFVFTTIDGETIYDKVHQAALTIAQSHYTATQCHSYKANQNVSYESTNGSQRSSQADRPQLAMELLSGLVTSHDVTNNNPVTARNKAIPSNTPQRTISNNVVQYSPRKASSTGESQRIDDRPRHRRHNYLPDNRRSLRESELGSSRAANTQFRSPTR